MNPYPSREGYYFPAEWYPHEATWLSWPHKEASWPGSISAVYPAYSQFIRLLAEGERVCINVCNPGMRQFAEDCLRQAGTDLSRVEFHLNPTNDAWCRDHGPAFLINPLAKDKKVIVDWDYNAWGNKYPPFNLDDDIPSRIGAFYHIPVYHPGIIMEGGAVDFNGDGTVLTTTSCLLNPNRNPHLIASKIEDYLKNYYGVSQVLWLEEGIDGDDTDGHIDDLVRFINRDTVVTVMENNPADINYEVLRINRLSLGKMRLPDGRSLNIVEIPMPSPIFREGMRLPASYANFYIANRAVIVPTFKDKNDQLAIGLLQNCFPDREVIGIDSTDIIWGLGSFHCLSQQEPISPGPVG
ncbi:MAG TPA: agmatine deiminase family protein [Chitinophagaceae bacterium]|nr:agmatine deiminase family protein [Chitinophagaceae bacterium]